MAGDCYGGGLVNRDGSAEITLSEIKGLLGTFSHIVGENVDQAAHGMQAGLKAVEGANNRYIMDVREESVACGGALFSLIQRVELIEDEHGAVGSVLLYMTDTDGRLASLVTEMGPGSLHVISPPLLGEAVRWNNKYDICHHMDRKEVCFGITEYEKGERLETITIGRGDD